MPRLFSSHRGYVAMATAVLAVSIGLNLFVFTIVNALWIRPLPVTEPDRVVTVVPDTVPSLNVGQLKVFQAGVAGQVVTSDVHEGLRPRIDIAGTSNVETLGVTPSYFRVLGLTVRGRDFTADDDRDGAEPVAVISDRFWTGAFARRAEIIGAVVPAIPVAIRIIGVAPAGFNGARRGERADLWITTALVRQLAPDAWSSENAPPLMVLARLRAGQTVAMVERQYRELMDSRAREWIQTYNPAALPTVTRLTDVFGTPQSRTLMIRERDTLLVVAGLAALVLLGGCGTIAALVLVHYERRRPELALKMSLGATRGRLIVELLGDLSCIAAVGSAGGLLFAVVSVSVVPALSLPGGVDIGRLDLSIDWRVSAVSIVASASTLFAAAALPIARSTRGRLAGELLTGPSATTLGSLRVRQTLLACQVCGTIIVLISAGLFVRSVIQGFGTAAGFAVERTVFASVQEGASFRSPSVDRQALIAERSTRLLARLRDLPGASDVAEGIPPIGPEALSASERPKILSVGDQELQLIVGIVTGTPNLLSTLGVPILAGRGLTAADAAAVTPRPTVMTSSLAARLWPREAALGQIVSLPRLRGGPYVVVGIAGDLAFGSLTRRASGVLVTTGPGTSSIVSHFVVRTDHPESVSAMIRRTIGGQVVRTATGKEVIARDIARQRLGAWFFSGFGAAALLLGVGGAFGLVAYLAESQRRELGVRLALGADLSDLIRHGLAAALVPVAAGVAAGLLFGGLVSQVFAALLTGVSPLDTLTYGAVAAIMLGSATGAATVAALRLRRMTPGDALRAN